MAQLDLDPERDPWDRQPRERGEHFDWFQHWRNDGERRSYPRTAQRFDVPAHRVRSVAHRNAWLPRVDAWRRYNSAQVKARFDELTEQILVPWMQGAARMVQVAVQSQRESDPAAALNAATNVLRLAKEPTVAELVRIAAAGAHEGRAPAGAPPGVAHTIMAALEEFPEARQAALDAVRAERDQRE